MAKRIWSRIFGIFVGQTHRREEVVAAAVEAAGGAMVFTGRRHFRH